MLKQFIITSVLATVSLGLVNCSSQPVKMVFEVSSSAPSYSNPLVVDKKVIFGNDYGAVTAVDRFTGSILWTFQAFKAVKSAPTLGENMLFFGSENHILYAIDLSGQEVWKYPTRMPIKSDPLYHEGNVYFTSYDGRAYCVTADKRKLVWEFPQPVIPTPQPTPEEAAKAKDKKAPAEPVVEAKPAEPPIVPQGFSYSSPRISNGVLYVGNLDGYLYALNITDGSLKWRFKTDSSITSTPLVQDGTIYIGSKDTYIYAIDEATGSKVHWKFKTGGFVEGSPKIKDGILYIGSIDKNMYAIDVQTGKEVCRFVAKGEIKSSVAFAQGLVFFGGAINDGNVYAIEEKTCKEVWKYPTEAEIDSDPAIAEDMLYVTSGSRKLYAFKVAAKK